MRWSENSLVLTIITALSLAGALVGCEAEPIPQRNSSGSVAGVGLTEATAPATPAIPSGTTVASAPVMVVEEAAVGASGKGNYSPGLVTTPVSAYFKAQERIIFEIQIPHAMQLYQATNGRFPADMDEFTREILVPSQIKLPELPPTHNYLYDAEQGKLMIEHPAP